MQVSDDLAMVSLLSSSKPFASKQQFSFRADPNSLLAFSMGREHLETS